MHDDDDPPLGPAPEPEDDALEAFAASQRKRRWIGLGVAAAVALVAGAVWIWWRATGLPPIDSETQKQVREAMDNLDAIPGEYHATLAAAAMAELEVGRLPEPMVEAFDDVSKVPPDMASLIMLRPFADDAESLKAWELACPNGADILAEAGMSGDLEQLFVDCDLGRFGIIDGHAAIRTSAGRLVLTHATWAYLVDHHSETELERRVLRVFVHG